MLQKRVRKFLLDDKKMFMLDLQNSVDKTEIQLDPDTDALVLEDIMGRIRGILVRDRYEGLCYLFVNENEADVADALVKQHLFMLKKEQEDGENL